MRHRSILTHHIPDLRLSLIHISLLISNMNVFAETDQKDTMFSDGVNQLASEIYGEMDAEGNVFFSPYSISVALSMLNLEADGETKAQIEDCLLYTSKDFRACESSQRAGQPGNKGFPRQNCKRRSIYFRQNNQSTD